MWCLDELFRALPVKEEHAAVLTWSFWSSGCVLQLIGRTTKLSTEGMDFFFYYALLGNDITSEPFQNVVTPSFEPERASLRIRSSEKVLRAYLSLQPSLEVTVWMES